MSSVTVNISCSASYRVTIELPDDIDTNDIDAVVDYINEEMPNISVTELEYLENSDIPVIPDDIVRIEK